ncbi:hypothetical protein NQZ68_035434 [Dissostichus eleginoides]|nr:hypothetical protein NQZ68_035434 [Dissostichus eleginoides]
MIGGSTSRLQRSRLRAAGLGSVQEALRYQNQDFRVLQEGFKELAPYSAKTRGVEWKRPPSVVMDQLTVSQRLQQQQLPGNISETPNTLINHFLLECRK